MLGIAYSIMEIASRYLLRLQHILTSNTSSVSAGHLIGNGKLKPQDARAVALRYINLRCHKRRPTCFLEVGS
jgi:hypothetical protein